MTRMICSGKTRPRQSIFLSLLVLLFLSIPLFSQAADPHSFTGKVVGVSDGDTISVMRGGRPEKRDLWVDKNPIPPWEWRETHNLVDLSEIIPDELWLTDLTIETTMKKKNGLKEVVEETHLIIKGVTELTPGRKPLQGIAALISALNSLESFQGDFERPTLVYTRLLREKDREFLEFEISSKLRLRVRAGETVVESFPAKVVGVSYGDMISVVRRRWPMIVRLYGIDCPKWPQPFGIQAKKFTSDLALGVWVEVHVSYTDWYSKQKAYRVILPNDKSLSYELVGAGMAWWHRTDAPNDRILKALEAVAQVARRGLWADKNPIPPWVWRRGKVATQERKGFPPPTCLRLRR